jgi:hypothetical protein
MKRCYGAVREATILFACAFTGLTALSLLVLNIQALHYANRRD